MFGTTTTVPNRGRTRPLCPYSYLSVCLIPGGLVAVMTQPKFVADFAAEAAALGGSITFSALVAGGLPALVAGGLPALVGYVLALRGCRRLDVRRGLKLRRYGARFPRFRGRTWASVCRARLFFRLLLHASHASVATQARVTSLAARHDGRGAGKTWSPGRRCHSRPAFGQSAYCAEHSGDQPSRGLQQATPGGQMSAARTSGLLHRWRPVRPAAPPPPARASAIRRGSERGPSLRRPSGHRAEGRPRCSRTAQPPLRSE